MCVNGYIVYGGGQTNKQIKHQTTSSSPPNIDLRLSAHQQVFNSSFNTELCVHPPADEFFSVLTLIHQVYLGNGRFVEFRMSAAHEIYLYVLRSRFIQIRDTIYFTFKHEFAGYHECLYHTRATQDLVSVVRNQRNRLNCELTNSVFPSICDALYHRRWIGEKSSPWLRVADFP